MWLQNCCIWIKPVYALVIYPDLDKRIYLEYSVCYKASSISLKGI